MRAAGIITIFTIASMPDRAATGTHPAAIRSYCAPADSVSIASTIDRDSAVPLPHPR
jgi:hypothetical protein